MARFRSAVLAAVSAMAGSLLLWEYARPRAAPASPLVAGRLSASGTPVEGSDQKQLIEQIINQASGQWAEAGIDSASRGELAKIASRCIQGQMDADFVSYDVLAHELGGKMSTRGVAVARSKRGFCRNIPEEQWQQLRTEDQLARIWAASAARHATWSRIETKHVRAGVGAIVGPADSVKTLDARFSVYNFPRRSELLRDAVSGTAMCAWVQMPVEFREDAGAVEIRMTFILDKTGAAWYPFRIDVIGPHPRPYLMF